VSGLDASVRAAFSRFSSEEPQGGPIGSGHINDTYELRVGRDEFVLQRVNPAVFPYAETQMENIRRILEHLEKKSPDPRSRLSLVKTREGTAYWKGDDGAVWRCYGGQSGTETFDVIDSPERAYEVAKAFGVFLRLLVDLPVPPLVETIPGFHDAPARFRAFDTASKNAPAARREEAADVIAFACSHQELSRLVPDSLPLHACHYDTKVNNVLFDRESKKAVCVVDLDTAMPGRIPIDFGDLVRSGASEAAEDCRDLDAVEVRPAVIKALATGFLEEVHGVISTEERAALPDAPAELAYELGVRFLMDFLEGDIYFKTKRPSQNLDRARVQFKLAEAFVRDKSVLAGYCGV